jgi:hypothetical protein
MKKRRFESVVSGFSGPKNLLELFTSRMWMKSHFFVALAVAEGTGRFGSGQQFELSANAKKRDRMFCDLAFEHTDQGLIFGVAPISYDSRMSNSLAAFALPELLHRAGRYHLAVIGVGLVFVCVLAITTKPRSMINPG